MSHLHDMFKKQWQWVSAHSVHSGAMLTGASPSHSTAIVIYNSQVCQMKRVWSISYWHLILFTKNKQTTIKKTIYSIYLYFIGWIITWSCLTSRKTLFLVGEDIFLNASNGYHRLLYQMEWISVLWERGLDAEKQLFTMQIS